MIEAKTAVQKAATYYRTVTGDNSQLRLEELELSEDRKEWHVTLSHPDVATQSISVLLGQPESRLYKAFIVDSESGDVKSMRAKKIS